MATNRSAPQPHTHHLRVERTARYYTLGAPDGAARAIWFVIHGYGQLAGQFVRYFSDLATDETMIVAPEALNRFYLVGVNKPASERPVGATWMTREDRESEVADYVEYLDALYDEIVANSAAAGATVTVVGFSQGAATATRWIAHGRSHVDRLILWGGLIPPETHLATGPQALRNVPITLVVGDTDQYVSAEMFNAELARLDAANIPHRAIRFDGGHVISRAVFPQLV